MSEGILSPGPSLRPSGRARAAAQLWLVNVVVGCGVMAAYLQHAPAPDTLRAGLFLYLGLLASAATLTLLPGLVTLALAAALRGAPVRRFVLPVLWTATHLALFVDTRIYGIFRYHFNGMVWNVLTTPGSDEAVHIRWQEKAVTLAVLTLLFLLLRVLLVRLERHALDGRRPGGLLLPFARPARAWGLAIVPAMLVVAGVYAHADLVRDREVMGLSKVYPFYPRVTVKRFARDHLGYDFAERPAVAVDTEGVMLAYPRTAPTLPTDGPRPDVLVIAVDSLRADMLTAETMPFTVQFARRARVFTDHLSSGNGTRFGVFGLVYGLYGSYWQAMLRENRSPVLVDALLEAGYDFTVLTSASMTFPEFTSTAWVRIEDRVEERLKGQREGGRDDGVIARFEEFVAGRRPDDPPYFGFVLLDAPHQSYDFPAEFARFTPYAESLSYIELGGSPDDATKAAVFNRYKNAVLYADDSLQRILGALEAAGTLEDTVVVITGDHGEEFYENGLLGHTSSFADVQVRVPMLLAGPGVEPGIEDAPTSHVDVAPTLLGLLGADLDSRPDWSLGEDMLGPPPRERARVVSGWDDLGVYVPGGIVHVPLAAYGGFVSVYDQRWRPVPDEDAVLAANPGVLARLALDCRRFLR